MGQGPGHQLDQVDRYHRHVPAPQDRDPAFAPVLEHGQLLGEGVDPVEGR
jgi:hypothetical protein